MNSEELEQSLRTEFESYLKDVLADMRQEISDLQGKVQTEFEKHKSQLDEIFRDFSARTSADQEISKEFSATVIEHLRLSRDEGARITATAIAEAEEMEKQNAPVEPAAPAAPLVGIAEIRDAINDISSKTTQSAILKTLVQHSSQFTPRGAFFIIKNEHLVGWRVFGKEADTDSQTVREVFFPVGLSTVLGESVRSLATVETAYGAYSDDLIYLNKLEFGQPDRMYSIPLIVRGRAVAVLYADYGSEDGNVNVEALETLVRVASLTVEVMASARTAKMPAEDSSKDFAESEEIVEETEETFKEAEVPETAESDAPEFVRQPVVETAESYQFAKSEEVYETEIPKSEREDFYTPKVEREPVSEFTESGYQEPVESDRFSYTPGFETKYAADDEDAVEEVSMAEEESSAPAEEYQISYEEPKTFETTPGWSQKVETDDYSNNYSMDSSSFEVSELSSFESKTETSPSFEVSEPSTFEPEVEPAVSESEFAPSLTSEFQEYQFETSRPFEAPQTQFEDSPKVEVESPVSEQSYGSYETQNGKSNGFSAENLEKVSEPVSKTSVRSRFSDRNVDLPIEVAEDERRSHNDARRFARLLVSEIKLYNEQKVKEGREANDLYERLREAIDRSREMYDKRVQPPVAAKFDYFHYELINTLAEGDESKLGESYPGPVV